MKNGEILELYEALSRISQNHELIFKVKVGYAMMKNRNILQPEAKLIYDMRRKIVLENGEIKENGDVVVPKDRVDETNTKIIELMNLENDVKILIVSIDEFDENQLSMEDIEGLQYMIGIPMRTGPAIEEKQE